MFTLKQNTLTAKRNLNKLSIIGIGVTLFCHTFCCILPMVGLIFGMNILSFSFHEYEEYFITLNLISIFLGFYFTYLHKKKKKCDHSHCHNTNEKIAYWIVTFISLVVLFIPHF